MSAAATNRVNEILGEIERLKKELVEVRRITQPHQVEDHVLTDLNGAPVRLSELFGDKDDLLVVHNMGRGCPYCSLWADGFVGHYPHLRMRCSFVLCSGDAWMIAKEFATARGWNFPVVSGAESDFAKAMGFRGDDGSWWPGVSAFHRKADGTIWRTGWSWFGPGDDFCATWPLLDLLQDGPNGWEPGN